MQVTVKHILSSADTGNRSTQREQPPKILSLQHIREAAKSLHSSFKEKLQTCTSIESVLQLEHAFLLALKTVQENLNPDGTHFFTNDTYHNTSKAEKDNALNKEGMSFLSSLLSPEGQDLDRLKAVCFHSYAAFGDQYSFFGTSSTGMVETLRRSIQLDAKSKIKTLEEDL